MAWWRCRTSKAPNSWIDWRDARTTAHRLIDATLIGLVKPEAMRALDAHAGAARARAPQTPLSRCRRTETRRRSSRAFFSSS